MYVNDSQKYSFMDVTDLKTSSMSYGHKRRQLNLIMVQLNIYIPQTRKAD